jgi:hypothetical protein
MDIISIDRLPGCNNLGDNYFDHLARVRINGKIVLQQRSSMLNMLNTLREL